MTPLFFSRLAYLLAGVAVLLGAFAAHGLRDRLDAYALSVFETGVRYQMYHALALMFVAYRYSKDDSPYLRRACISFSAGILIFSGSLYVLALNYPQGKILGAITPMGGVCFVLGWLFLLLRTYRS
jgi:uncharacterized membrane protein YgdD (TMEM256/DUF423 family)